MVLRSGRLGPYEIVAPLGAGGMGEVYRARDTRLGREVALKVLPSDLASHPERLRRFEREARAVSALNHPNIVVLHDVGREQGIDFLVMELIEGETLAERLARGALPLDQLIRLGRQICSALEACHRKGMVHRDLKPGNIMLTSSGVKLLDFGLARALEEDPSSPSTMSGSAAPTAASPLTREGIVVGTLPYMAPEQIHGGPVDARCDIFALGAVLYEAATGRRAFEGETNSAVARAVLAADPPPPSTLVPESPKSLDRLIRLCLEKDPEDRYRSPHDVGLQLAAIAEEGTPASPATRASPRAASWIATALALLFVGLLAYVLSESHERSPAGSTRAVLFQVAPPPGGRFVSHVEGPLLAVSPDGSQVAFVATVGDSRSRVFVRALDELELTPVEGTDGAYTLFWSPDSRSIGFFTPDQLKRVDISGAAPLAPVTIVGLEPGAGRTGTWGPTEILFSSIQGEAVYRVSPDGGPVEVLLRPDASRGETRTNWPWLLPDGKSFLYSLKTDDGQMHLELGRAGPGREEPREIGLIRSHAQFVEPGFLIYAKEGVLLGQRFDASLGRLEGSPFPLAPAVRYFQSNGAAAFATSLSGTLAYRSQRDVMRLTWFDRSGRELGTLGSPGEYLNLALSADGKRLLFDRTRPNLGTWDLWRLDVDRGIETRLTASPDTENGPVWLPDGSGMVYFAVQGRLPQLVRRDFQTESDALLAPSQGFQMPFDVSPDGHTLLFAERNAEGVRLWTLSFEPDGSVSNVAPFPLLIQGVGSARFSPDGRWIAFVSSESGRYEGYVTSREGNGEKLHVSSENTWILRWARGGRELIYLTFDGRVFSVPVTASEGRLHLGKARLDFHLPKNAEWTTFEVAPDGERILAAVIESSGDERPATVVVNWPSLVKP